MSTFENHLFFFFPPDFLPPEDLEAADFLDAEPLDFLAEDLPFPPFFDFWTWAGPPPPDGVPPPPELDPLE